ncbi:hypothetical protein Taro_051033 [Colocasia esculenta]|uniref:Uncharacterized protein n=1 Tax=Colocasia esculenta TaxID=4460 RepID=A0A843XEX7_COLES|nr:hypothetical protein [Colocasia esculenta]
MVVAAIAATTAKATAGTIATAARATVAAARQYKRKKTLVGATKGVYIDLEITCIVGTVPVDTSGRIQVAAADSHKVAVDSY